MILDAKIPEGPIEKRWEKRKMDLNLVNTSNRKKYNIIVIGSGLAGSSAAASLAEMGYYVKVFCFQDSPRRAHSIAAQGGINAAKNYKNDGDSPYRLFYETIKGGDFRARESNVYRLAEVSLNIIDQCVAQGVPFARDYGGFLETRAFGGAQVARTFYAKGQTGQQLLIGAYGALNCQIDAGQISMYTRHEMLELVLIDGHARGIVARDLVTGELETHAAHSVVLASGGYGNVYYLSTNAMGSNVTAAWKAYKKGAGMANPCYTQIHPTCIPVSGSHQSKLTLMSESLRNDGRVWIPKKKNDSRSPENIPDDERDYFLERKYPVFGNLVPRDVAARGIKEMCDKGMGVAKTGISVYLDFRDSIKDLGKNVIEKKYGNLFSMYQKITDENPYEVPMRIYPAVHYVMGGLWVDYHLMTTIPGLYAIGESNFSDHGANRLGASALMQGLADGYFVLPYTIGDYISTLPAVSVDATAPAFKEALDSVRSKLEKLFAINGTRTVDNYHRQLGLIMWDKVGIARNETSLKQAIQEIQELRADFYKNLYLPGKQDSFNLSLEKATRVADLLELGELMALDALERNESCGAHFREEYQTDDNEAKRDDENFSHTAVWEYLGENTKPNRHKEELKFEYVHLAQRSYK